MKFKEMKKLAKAQLEGNYGKLIVILLIYSGIYGVASYTFVGSILLVGPFAFSFAYIALRVLHEKNVDIPDIFEGFKNFGSTLVTGLLVTVYTYLWTLLFIVPGIIKSLSYSMTYFILKDHPEYSANEAITLSRKMMNGHKWRYFLLALSFIGWGLLGILTFGILYLWVIPYIQVTNAVFYEDLKKQYENKVEVVTE